MQGLKTSGSRDELMQRCHDHNLVTAHERLTQRNAMQSRRAVLEYELQLVGCKLRSDSVLCNRYIDYGEGNPVDTAGIMADMKMYHAFTFRQKIILSIRKTRFSEWLERTFSDYVNDYEFRTHAASISRTFLNEDVDLSTLTDTTFQQSFGEPLVQFIAFKQTKLELIQFVKSALEKAGYNEHDALYHVVLECMDKRVLLPKFRQAFEETVATTLEMRGAPERFSAKLLQLFDPYKTPSNKVLLEKMDGRWQCNLCHFSGDSVSMRSHWSRDHHVSNLKNMLATRCVSESQSTFMLQVKETWVRINARHHAARVIQRCWRLAIACPDFEACRRRLMREAAELDVV